MRWFGPTPSAATARSISIRRRQKHRLHGHGLRSRPSGRGLLQRHPRRVRLRPPMAGRRFWSCGTMASRCTGARRSTPSARPPIKRMTMNPRPISPRHNRRQVYQTGGRNDLCFSSDARPRWLTCQASLRSRSRQGDPARASIQRCSCSVFQCWEAEFSAIGLYVVLSIFLRQEGSPESKPVGAGNEQTGGTNE